MNMLHVCAFDVNSLDNFLKVACIKLTLLSNRGLLVNDLFDVTVCQEQGCLRGRHGTAA
jgi:hypothetical protein